MDGLGGCDWEFVVVSDHMVVARIAIMLGVIALPGCDAPVVNALGPPYDPTALTGGIIYHWPVGSSIAIHVVPWPASDDRLTSSVRNAARQWVAILAYREHSLRVVDDPSAADIIVRDSRAPSPVEIDCAGVGWGDAAGSTVFCPLDDTARTLDLVDGGGGRTKILISIDVLESDSYASGLPPIVLHEIGHALGIGGHSPVAGDAMFAIPGAPSPSRRDALTLRYVLHRRPDLTL